MAKQVILSANLQDFRPILWYGQPVFERFQHIKAFLTEKLGGEFEHLLSEPVITQGSTARANFMSAYVTQGKPLSKLAPQEQENAKVQLSGMLQRVEQLAKSLTQSPEDQKMGELLNLAIQVPNMEAVYVESNKITLVLWGFTSEETEKQNFSIMKTLEKASTPPVPPIPPTPPSPPTPPTNPTPPVEKPPVKENPPENKMGTQSTTNTPPPPPPPPEKKKKGFSRWLWMLLGALIMFVIMLLCFIFCFDNNHGLPPEHAVLPPIDTTQVGVDPEDPAKRKIFTDKLNIALNKDVDFMAFAKKLDESYSDNLEVVYYDTVIKLLQVKTPEGELRKWTDSLKAIKEIRLVFNDALFSGSTLPTDPGFASPKESWYFDPIGAKAAWTVSQGTDAVVVAIIDNGFDLTHPEFAGKIVKPWNMTSNSNDVHPVPVDGGEHGTHVAGSAVGLANNGVGIAGIAPNCKFMPIQVAYDNGMMTSLGIASGILYAIHKEADIINMSLGMMFPPEMSELSVEEQKQLAKTLYPDEAIFWDDIYQFAAETGILIVQAAGNSNLMAGIDPSGRSDHTIVVAAQSPDLQRAGFSNYGEYTDISAPGVEIYSSVPGNGFAFLQGTSMASPIVAGAAALVKSVYPEYTPKQIKDLLVSTATPVSADKYIGPQLNIGKALGGAAPEDTMIIPDDPKDLSFAEGRWKSSEGLISTIDNSKVTLYFDIEKTGKGELMLVEEKSDGRHCKAALAVTFESGKLVMTQTEPAYCAEDSGFYHPYHYECVQGEKNVAKCTAKQKDGSGTLLEFELRKVK